MFPLRVAKQVYNRAGVRFLGSTEKKVRIACASGFWGDTPLAARQLIKHAEGLDYIVFDYLSEITMSLLARMRAKKADLGFTPDFIEQLAPLVRDITEKNIRIVANAGGVNPAACAAMLDRVAKKSGVDLRIAVVTGDDISAKEDTFRTEGITDMSSGEPFPVSGTVASMNVYLGAGPIKQALAAFNPHVVITGRCADSALVLAPLMHEFGWKTNDWDKLAAGSLAGHVIECGTQCTGGFFSGWRDVPHSENVGFPIVEVSASGDFVVSKPPHTGGSVTEGTVAEQMLYEIGDPRSYILPDVICDFSNVSIKQTASNTVSVTGAKGMPAPKDYKVSATYTDGYRATAVVPVVGPRAIEKAEHVARAVLKRTSNVFDVLGFGDYDKSRIEVLGSEAWYGKNANDAVRTTREVVLWMAVQHQKKEAVGLFTKEIAPAVTSMAPGMTVLVGGRPRVSPVFRLFSFAVDRSSVSPEVFLHGNDTKVTVSESTETGPLPPLQPMASHPPAPSDATTPKRLEEIAYLRSGDKGDDANVAVIAKDQKYYECIRAAVTKEAVAKYFLHAWEQDVSRAWEEDPKLPSLQEAMARVEIYDVPGVCGLNILLRGALGGGGVASLRSDPQGKAYGQRFCDFEVPVSN